MVDEPPAGRARHGPTFLGIDLGTSSVKAVVTDGAGKVLAQAAKGYPVDHPYASWAETNPELWWSAIISSVREATAAAPDPVLGIGLAGQMHGIVPTNSAGIPQRPAIIWADSRAVGQLRLYRNLPKRLRIRLANPLAPGMAGPLLAWLAVNEPATYRDTHWVLQPKDWVRSRLTGRLESEPSDASATLLYDIAGDCWNNEVVEALGLNPAILPPLLSHSGANAGTLIATAAEQLGLHPGTPVAAGAGDAAAAALGSGLADETQAQLTIGTGVQIIVPASAVALPSEPESVVTHLYRAATRHGWYRMAAVQSGGLALSWVIQVLGATWAELYDSASTPVRLDDPIFLPHLGGERTPYLDPSLRGAWTGLGPGHDRSTLLRTALEGVAFTISEAVNALPRIANRVDHLRIAGGGSTAPSWRQMLADVLGYQLRAVHVPAASGRGAALLGACAAGQLDELTLLQLLTPDSELAADPNPGRADLYAHRRRAFRQVLQALRQTTETYPGGPGPR
jgi:xylulokinase